ncbi:MAG TPA: aminoacyl-tRNA hydrolase [Bacteroidia bacterium]|nr:aminoacyl-tRNA hydrolase [Bacteroidia bacterium]
MSKFLIAGLGNPGAEYAGTRHNIGFGVLDFIAQQHACTFSNTRYAHLSEWRHRGKPVFLIKPTTYMNLSGKAVQYWMQAEKIAIENILVIADDIALPFGTLRLRAKGSDGGHNGLKSIQECLNNTNYARLRFGVGSNFPKGRQADYVLGSWDSEELAAIPEKLKLAEEIVKSFIGHGVNRTMNDFNKR